MKEEKGITLVALILTVVVLIILAGVSMQTGTESIESTRLQGFYTQLEIIQKRVDDIAATNESYVDSIGNIVYIKEQGVFYDSLTDEQKATLQAILQIENLTSIPISNFRYFTVQDLKDILDLTEIEYNVFIDFDNRIVVAENGIKIQDKTYYALENATYFVEQNVNKNVGVIESLTYEITNYSTDKYKVNVTPSNVIGDLEGTGYVKYKITTTKYWETSTNTEMIIELEIEYNIVYIDSNNNSIEKTIKVELDDNGNPTVKEI